MPQPTTQHVPVLLNAVLEALAPRPGSVLIDGTLGGGGHTRALAQLVAPDGYVLAFDRDPAAIAAAEEHLRGQCVKVVHASYAEIPEVLAELEVRHVDGVLLDLGLSSDQLADDARGFSFHSEGELDLRFDTSSGEPAWRLIARLGADELADLIYRYGEERFSRRIARKLVERRETGPLTRADEIAELIRRALPRARPGSIDPATRTFQALRIAVNDELGALERTLGFLPDVLRPGGRAAIISFHSLEDRLVKQAFRADPRYKPLTSKPVVASESEVHQNPRARSAKLRVAERVAT